MQAKITYYNPFSTDLTALPSMVISFNRGSGGSDVDITQTTGQSRTSVMSQAATTEALAGKVDAVAGKGLSSNDYTAADQNKLAGLPGSVYSKTEIDNKFTVATGGTVISPSEVEVGAFCMVGGAGEIRQPVYSKLAIVADLPKTAGESAEYLLSEDPLGCNLYFSVDSFVISSDAQLRSEMFLSLYEIVKVYVDDAYRTKVVIRCRETTTQTLRATINVRYIKPYSERVELEIACAAAPSLNAVSVAFPALKYDKKALVSFTTDDANASSYCRVWAAINGRPVSNKFYHANQLAAGDVPAEIVDTTLAKTLGCTDGCGVEQRFRHGVAIWPHSQANGNTMMDSINPVAPTATNLYRFMTPYLQWGDLAQMVKFGVGVYYHNIGVEQFGSDKVVENVVAGLRADCERSIERINRGIKILARPDGNNTFLEAAQQSGQILFSVAENTPAEDLLPCTSPDLFKSVGLRFFPTSSGSSTEQDMVKARFTEEYAKAKEQRKWFHFCCHTADMAWVNLLVWFNDNYGKDGSDDIWFATVDEVYEYMYARNNALIRKSVEGNKLRITAYIPQGQYFYYPDFSLLVNGAGNVTSVGGSANITGLSWGTHDDGLLINVNTNKELPALAEEFTTKFEQTGQTVYKTDALYFASQLEASRRATYIERIEAVRPGSVTLLSIEINGGTPSTTSRMVTLLPVFNGTPTHYRIGETADLSGQAWTAYSAGSVSFTLSPEYGQKTVYMQLKNTQGESSIKSSSISYDPVSTEIPLSSLAISGSTSVAQGASVQFSVTYTPANTTQRGVVWTSSDPTVATVDASGRVTAAAAGSVVITARSTVNDSIFATHNITISGGVTTNAAALFANYSWPDFKVDHLLDATAGKYLNISNNNNSSAIAPANQVYDMNTGEVIPGWSRLSNDQKKAYYGLTVLDNWNTAPAYNADLTELFSTPLSYDYSFRYNGVVYPVVGWSVPNGTYKVSILSSTTHADVSTNAHIKINNVEVTMPSISFQDNKQWMEFSGIQVTDGALAIMMYGETNKRIGYNVIKVEKS